jgi:hypothetical protein
MEKGLHDMTGEIEKECERRHQPPITSEEVRVILREELEKWPNIGAEKHTDHHRWLEAQIQKEEAERDMYWSVAKSVAQYSVLGLLGIAWAWLNHYFTFKP